MTIHGALYPPYAIKNDIATDIVSLYKTMTCSLGYEKAKKPAAAVTT